MNSYSGEYVTEKSRLHKLCLLTRLSSCSEVLSTYSTNCLWTVYKKGKERHAPEDSQQARRSVPLSSAPES